MPEGFQQRHKPEQWVKFLLSNLHSSNTYQQDLLNLRHLLQ